MDQRKWPDREHWQFPMRYRGEDEHGCWYYVAPDTSVHRGDEPARPMGDSLVVLVPDNQWWIVEFTWDNPQHTVYVNIGTPVERHGDRITTFDLDLDVVRELDGSVLVIDEDEFAAHQVEYAYPQRLIDGARSAADQAAQMLREGIEPFGSAPDQWIALAQST
ncbi:MAG: DUF402 domain-containing protein [Actinomycetota bacterium]